MATDDNSMQNTDRNKNRLVLSARSLSLELAKHKHRVAAQLVSLIYISIIYYSFFFFK